MAWPLLAARGGHNDLKRRLKIQTENPAAVAEPAPRKSVGAVREKAAKTAQEFYAKSDPENVARLRLKLIQAGYMDPRAVGMFFLIRFGGFVVGALGALLVNNWMASAEATAMSRWGLVIIMGAAGYFLPGLVLGRLISTKMREIHNGFPDFMDLMIVCSDAGMAMEAGIERVSKELATTYPSLAGKSPARLTGTESRAQSRRRAEIAGRPIEPRRGTFLRHAFAAVQGTRHQPVRRAAGLFGRNASQAHVAGRGKGACASGEDVGAGDRLHPAGGVDDRHHPYHSEDDRRRLTGSALVNEPLRAK